MLSVDKATLHIAVADKTGKCEFVLIMTNKGETGRHDIPLPKNSTGARSFHRQILGLKRSGTSISALDGNSDKRIPGTPYGVQM